MDKDANSPFDWQTWLRTHLEKRFGRRVVGALIAAIASGILIYQNSEKILSIGLVEDGIAYATQPVLPKAQPGQFTVLIARLENDKRGKLQGAMSDSLAEMTAMHTMKIHRRLDVQGRNAEEECRSSALSAQSYLKETGAQILLYGKAVERDLDSKTKVFEPRLCWAAAEGVRPDKEFGRYPAQGGNALPDLFWTDLAAVLKLLVAGQYASFESDDGRFAADRLQPFVATVSRLLESRTGRNTEWTATQAAEVRLILAAALTRLGDERGDKGLLAAAAAGAEDALKVFTRENHPTQWARAQCDFGNALRRLGEREQETERLERAIGVFTAALEVRTQTTAPQDWATTKNDLGVAMKQLGVTLQFRGHRLQRDEDIDRALELLESAVAAYREALTVRTRGQVPQRWANTTSNMANALASLGEINRNPALLNQSVDAYEEALGVLTRDAVPLDWAMVQSNLGAALSRLGDIEDSAKRFELAAAAYRQSLEVRQESRTPLLWATTRYNLAVVLRKLGERRQDATALAEAEQAYTDALRVAKANDHAPLVQSAEIGLEATKEARRIQRAAPSCQPLDRNVPITACGK